MVEDRVSEILHNFYESYPHMSSDRMNDIYCKIAQLKEETYNRAKEVLLKYNLSIIMVMEDLDNWLVNRKKGYGSNDRLSELSDSQLREVFEALSDREYIKITYKYLTELNGIKALHHEISREMN